MIAQTGGDWYLCGGCGHLVQPANPLFQCTCSKCVVLSRQPRRQSRREEEVTG
jgi:hypothetical protein